MDESAHHASCARGGRRITEDMCGHVLKSNWIPDSVCFITGGPIKQFSELLIHTIKLLAVSPEGGAGRRGMEREGEKSSNYMGPVRNPVL